MAFRSGTQHLFPEAEWLTEKPRHRAVITKGGKMIAYGESTLGGTHGLTRNLADTSKAGTRRYCRSTHAEINCIKALPRNFEEKPRKLRQCVLWSVRWTRQGSLALALPCNYCRDSLIRRGITTCIYSDETGSLRRCDLREMRGFTSSGELE